MKEKKQIKQKPSFIRFHGLLDDNLSFEIKPGWETAYIARHPGQSDPALKKLSHHPVEEGFVVELLGEKRTAIISRKPEILQVGPCEKTPHSSALYEVTAYLPMHPDARWLVFRRGDLVIFERGLAASPPQVKINSLNIQRQRASVSWEAKHEKSHPLWFNVGVVIDKKRVFLLAKRIKKTEVSVDLSVIPGAKEAHITVLASDGLRSGFDLSAPFKIPEKSLQLFISRPGMNEVFSADQPVSFNGQALDIAGSSMPENHLVWKLDEKVVLQGKLNGVLPNPSPGDHTLRLEWLDDGKPLFSKEVKFKIAPQSKLQKRYRNLIKPHLNQG